MPSTLSPPTQVSLLPLTPPPSLPSCSLSNLPPISPPNPIADMILGNLTITAISRKYRPLGAYNQPTVQTVPHQNKSHPIFETADKGAHFLSEQSSISGSTGQPHYLP